MQLRLQKLRPPNHLPAGDTSQCMHLRYYDTPILSEHKLSAQMVRGSETLVGTLVGTAARGCGTGVCYTRAAAIGDVRRFPCNPCQPAMAMTACPPGCMRTLDSRSSSGLYRPSACARPKARAKTTLFGASQHSPWKQSKGGQGACKSTGQAPWQ